MNNPPNKALAVVSSAWKHSPHELISLWDMIQFFSGEVYSLLGCLELNAQAEAIRNWYNPEFDIKQTIRILNQLKKSAESAELTQSNDRCTELKEYLSLYTKPDPGDWMAEAKRSLAKPFSPEIVGSQIKGILSTFDKELREKKFAYIPSEKAHYFERDDLFGKTVHENSSAELNAEIKAAGNCLAADLNTAAVFHLMCVVEHGLRALARHLKVKSVKKLVPIELGTWEEIITALGKKVEALGKTTRSKKREKELDFYNELLVEYRGFKDFWRNKVAHARVSYSPTKAKAAFEHVRAFTEKLSGRISLK